MDHNTPRGVAKLGVGRVSPITTLKPKKDPLKQARKDERVREEKERKGVESAE